MSISPRSCRSPLGFNRKPQFRTHIFQLYQNVFLESNREVLEAGDLFFKAFPMHCSVFMSLMNCSGFQPHRPDCEEWKEIKKGKSLSYWFSSREFFWDFWPNPQESTTTPNPKWHSIRGDILQFLDWYQPCSRNFSIGCQSFTESPHILHGCPFHDLEGLMPSA